MKIDFIDYYERYKERVLAGRPEGKSYREILDLDNLDKVEECIEIIIPDIFLSLNSSFFLGCFGPSIRNLGESGFRQKYIFNCDMALRTGIEDGISRALNQSVVI